MNNIGTKHCMLMLNVSYFNCSIIIYRTLIRNLLGLVMIFKSVSARELLVNQYFFTCPQIIVLKHIIIISERPVGV